MRWIGDGELRVKLNLGSRFADAVGFDIRLRYVSVAQSMRDQYEEQTRLTEITTLDDVCERDYFTKRRRLA